MTQVLLFKDGYINQKLMITFVLMKRDIEIKKIS